MLAVSLILAATVRTLSLEDALHQAEVHQPQIHQANANTRAGYARMDEARAPLLPQLNLTGTYQRTTGNYVYRPGTTLSVTPSLQGTCSLDRWNPCNNFFNFGLTLTQYIWDFGVSTGRWKSAEALAEGLSASERATKLTVALNVRNAYFNARAMKALMDVAQENLSNQDKHLGQVAGFVKAGTRADIDLAQAKSDRATAVVQLVTAENNYQVAKVQLSQTIGLEGGPEYDVQDESMPVIPGEDQTGEKLLDEAIRARPEVINLERQIRAQMQNVVSAQGNYAPALNAGAAITEQGTQISNLGPNWNVNLNLTWNLFGGLLTASQVKEARANVDSAMAAFDLYRQQLRVEVEQARLGVRAAKTALDAAEEALTNARERLRLAEVRYKTGVGYIIELGDSQLALNTAAAQEVQSKFNLAAARAQLLHALGRP